MEFSYYAVRNAYETVPFGVQNTMLNYGQRCEGAEIWDVQRHKDMEMR